MGQQRPQRSLRGQRNRHSKDVVEATRLVKEFADAHLQGRERRRARIERVAELSGRSARTGRPPLPIVAGMARARKLREERAVKNAKESGMYDSKLTAHLYRTPESGDGAAGRRGGSRRPAADEAGLTGQIGTYRNGALHIDPSIVRRIEQRGSKSERDGGGGRGRGSGPRSARAGKRGGGRRPGRGGRHRRG